MWLELLPHLRQLDIVLASGSPRRLQLLRDNFGLDPRVVPSTFAEDLGHGNFPTPERYCLATAQAKVAEVVSRLMADVGDRKPFDLVIGSDTIVVSPNDQILEKATSAAHAKKMIRALSGKEHRVVTALVLAFPATAPTKEQQYFPPAATSGDVAVTPTSASSSATASGTAAKAKTSNLDVGGNDNRAPSRSSSVLTASDRPLSVSSLSTGPFGGSLRSKNAAHFGIEVRATYTVTKVKFAELSDAEIDAYVANEAAWRGKAGAYGIQDLASAFVEGINGDYYTVMGLPLHVLASEVAALVCSGAFKTQ